MPQLEDLARDVFTAIEAHDFGRLEELLAPDCDVVVPGFSGRGPQAFIAWMQPFLGAFPDIRHELGTVAEAGDVIGFELRVSGTHTEAMRSPAGEIPATGRPLDLPAANMWRTDGGRIVAYHVYFDQMEFLGQLGLLPEPAATG
jgi:ketosteroid isomerase-like protein